MKLKLSDLKRIIREELNEENKKSSLKVESLKKLIKELLDQEKCKECGRPHEGECVQPPGFKRFAPADALEDKKEDK